jgi:hypothetical protein
MPAMSILPFLALHLSAGWLAGKAFAMLMRAREGGGFRAIHWLILAVAMSAAMLFARFVIGGARRMPDVPDIAVGLGGIAMLAVFIGSSGLLRNGRR